MKKIVQLLTILAVGYCSPGFAQQLVTGRVTGPAGEPLAGTSVLLTGSRQSVATDGSGHFSFAGVTLPDTLLFSHVGYLSETVPLVVLGRDLEVKLRRDENVLQEVTINTGYYTVPRERATGAFTHIDNELLNRSASQNILDRLEGIALGVQFDRRNLDGGDVYGQPEIRVRGLSTIESNSQPLIVVDNFPFEGDINTINPNDVESVTVLRDAAAASIWGARAGNGVIVITTKQGRYNQPTRVSFNTNVNVAAKPDLFYSDKYLPSSKVMEIEKELFLRGAYPESDAVRIPPYVELLIKQRDARITQQEFNRQESYMRATDLRDQAVQWLYREAVQQQYALNIRGGGDRYNYSFTANRDDNRLNLVGNGNNRLNIGVQNTFKLTDGLELDGSFWYTQQHSAANGFAYDRAYPIYRGLLDVDGNPQSVFGAFRLKYLEEATESGLLDWQERPLDEIHLVDHTRDAESMRFNLGLTYNVFKDLQLRASYQYTKAKAGGTDFYDKESYYVRNIVNRFTQADGTRIVPHNSIMDYLSANKGNTHAARLQADYHKQFGPRHEVNLLGGAEVGQLVSTTIPGVRLYGFDNEIWTANSALDYSTFYPTRPSGRAAVTFSSYSPEKVVNRTLSYFSNGSYTLDNKYVLSASTRWDGSNLLGVKTNQRGTVLWSVGGSWEVSKEAFFRLQWLPYLRLRATYGSAGNIDKTQSHYPTVFVQTNTISNLTQSNLTSPGNPSLRWERVNTMNAGLDWALKNQRISGSFEYYRKWSDHLLGAVLIDPTLGIPSSSTYKTNYGSMQTQGWDLQLNTRNTTGPLAWNTILLMSTTRNRITYLEEPTQWGATVYFDRFIPVQDRSVDVLYAFPWFGLDGQNGLPRITVDGAPTTDMAAYGQFLNTIRYEDLRNAGVTVPTFFGTLRNSFTWRQLTLDFAIGFKAGHVFRRPSLASGQEYNTFLPAYHMDYYRRWQKPGDELTTSVPAAIDQFNPQLEQYYRYSEVLIEKGDVIRLNDINIRYRIGKNRLGRLPFQEISTSLYLKNLAILWRANDAGIDPDYPATDYPAPINAALGIQLIF